jgi:hypothetical protein
MIDPLDPSRMSEHSDFDGAAPWIDTERRHEGLPGDSRIEAIPDAESDTVTFVSTHPDVDDPTTAWITAPEEFVFDVADVH